MKKNCPICDNELDFGSGVLGTTYWCMNNDHDYDHDYNHYYNDAMVIRIGSSVIVRYKHQTADMHWGYIKIRSNNYEKEFDEFQSDEKILKYIEQIKLLA
jgi:hypothetical protein